MGEIGDTSLVTVVVPVHNTAPHLIDRALRSALAQSYDRIEVIVVDDGSDDGTRRLLRETAGTDPRITLLSQPNGGVSAARNAALDRSRGGYVCFLDSDDYLTTDFLSSAMGVVVRCSVDIVFGGIQVLDGELSATWRAGSPPHSEPRVVEGTELDRLRSLILSPFRGVSSDIALGSLVPTNVVGALYSRRVASAVRFPLSVMQAEDQLYNVQALRCAERIGFVPATWYIYDRSNQSSSTRSLTPECVPRLVKTVDAFARAGGLVGADGPAISGQDSALRSSAADGAAGYVRLAVIVASGARTWRETHQRVHGLLEEPSVVAAMRASTPRSWRQRLFRVSARAGWAWGLVGFGRIDRALSGGETDRVRWRRAEGAPRRSEQRP